jgi:hypothetical protein
MTGNIKENPRKENKERDNYNKQKRGKSCGF